MNIYDLIGRAQRLRQETKLDSVSPDRVGALCEDTLKYINEFQLMASSPVMHKTYVSFSAMQADAAPMSDITGKALKSGQLVVIVPANQSDSTAGDVYRYDNPSGNSSAWTYIGKIGGVPADAELSETSTNPIQNKVVAKSFAQKNGRYPKMSVGFADNLVGHGESTPAEFSFRASGGDRSIADGVARIKMLRGNTVVWNQKIDKQYVSGDSVLTLRAGESLIKGHKYLLIRTRGNGGCFLLPMADTYDYRLGDNQYALIFTSAYAATSSGIYPSYPHVYCSAESGYVSLIDLTLMFGTGNEPTTVEEYNARKPIVADEYEYNAGELLHCNVDAIKSVGDNAWDEHWEIGGIREINGEEFESGSYIRTDYIRILPNMQYAMKKPQGIVTYLYFYDSNKSYVGWLDPFATIGEGGLFTTLNNASYMRFTCMQTTYNNDIMLTLVHSGWKMDINAGYQPYWEHILEIDQRIRASFTNGMHKWDKVFNKDGKGYVVRGTRSVDLGDLDWASAEAGHFYAANSLENCGYGNLICAKYVTGPGQFSDMPQDKTIGNNLYEPYNRYIFVRDDAYKDAASFKAAMAGVMLYYEFAESTIMEYDQPFNFDYKVADFGTEEAICTQPSAPISADIVYQFNAVDTIRNNQIEIDRLKSIINDMQIQLTSLM